MKFETKVLRKVATYYYNLHKPANPDMTIKIAIRMAIEAMDVISQAEEATREEVKGSKYN